MAKKAAVKSAKKPEKINSPFLGLSEENFKVFKYACNRTLHAIGADLGDQEMSRATVVEVVLDADYMRMYGKPNSLDPKGWTTLYDETLDPWIQDHYDTPAFNELMKQVFPCATYGL